MLDLIMERVVINLGLLGWLVLAVKVTSQVIVWVNGDMTFRM